MLDLIRQGYEGKRDVAGCPSILQFPLKTHIINERRCQNFSTFASSTIDVNSSRILTLIRNPKKQKGKEMNI